MPYDAGIVRNRPLTRSQAAELPHHRPPAAFQNPTAGSNSNGRFSRIVDLIVTSFYFRLFSSVFPPPPDLNNAPAPQSEGLVLGQAGTSNHEDVQATRQPLPPPTIAIDDDVVESSASAFAEARRRSRRNRGRTEVVAVDVHLEDRITRITRHNCRRVPRENVTATHSVPPPPPKEPTFSCPICMGPLVEEMSTKCGHIFCKRCIKTAITANGKCPFCRKKVTARELIRVFLPATK